MELAVIIPVLAMSDEMIRARIELLREKALPTTQFHIYQSQRGPGAIESRCDRQLAGDEVMRLSCQAQRDGCAAAIVWCAGDPAVDAARELVDIPVIGTGEAGMLFAYHLAQNFCLLTGDEDLAATSYDVAVRSGLGRRMVSIRGIQMSVEKLRTDREAALEKLAQVAEEAVRQDGAHAFVFGCLALTGMGEALTERIGLRGVAGGEPCQDGAAVQPPHLCGAPGAAGEPAPVKTARDGHTCRWAACLRSRLAGCALSQQTDRKKPLQDSPLKRLFLQLSKHFCHTDSQIYRHEVIGVLEITVKKLLNFFHSVEQRVPMHIELLSGLRGVKLVGIKGL
mgnify:CR=1 FL=1